MMCVLLCVCCVCACVLCVVCVRVCCVLCVCCVYVLCVHVRVCVLRACCVRVACMFVSVCVYVCLCLCIHCTLQYHLVDNTKVEIKIGASLHSVILSICWVDQPYTADHLVFYAIGVNKSSYYNSL